MRFSRSAGGAAAIATALLALVMVQAAVADPAKQPVDRPNKADVARAKSSVIRQVDVFEGFRPERSRQWAPGVPHCASYPGDRSNITVTGDATASFRRYDNSMAATVLWFKTTADSDRYWRTTANLKYVKCFAPALQKAFGAKARLKSAREISMYLGYADKVAAYRTVIQVAGKTSNYSWIDTTAFVKKGRAIALIRTVWVDHLCDCHNDLGQAIAIRMALAARAG